MAVQIKSRQSVKKKTAFAHPHNQPWAWAVWLSLFLWHKWRTGFKPGPSVSELIKHQGTYSPTPLFLGEINGSFLNLRTPPKNWWVPSRILQTCWRYVEKSGWQVLFCLFCWVVDRLLYLTRLWVCSVPRTSEEKQLRPEHSDTHLLILTLWRLGQDGQEGHGFEGVAVPGVQKRKEKVKLNIELTPQQECISKYFGK